MPTPPYTSFIEPLLRVLAENPAGVDARSACEKTAERLSLSAAAKAELLPSGRQPTYVNRTRNAFRGLKRERLAENSVFGTWRITPSGLALHAAHPTALPHTELARLSHGAVEGEDEVGEVSLSEWRERLAGCRSDSAFWADRARINQQREQLRPEFLSYLQRYFEGAVPLEEFRASYDTRTRRDWACFGAKGPAGAMVLNQLARNMPDPVETDTRLKRLLQVPRDDDAASRALRSFEAYLEEVRRQTAHASKIPRTGHVPNFVTAFWHVQQPEEWPSSYASAREVLRNAGAFDPEAGDAAEAYCAFRRAFRELQHALGVSSWDLESLLVWTHSKRENEAPDVEPEDNAVAASRPQVWLIAVGRNSANWDECHRAGVIGIDWDELGDLRKFDSVEAIRAQLRSARGLETDPMNAGLACWQFAHEMRAGDTVYVKKGRHLIIGQGIIRSDYRFDPSGPMPNLRSVEWLSKGEWRPREKPLAVKTLTEIGQYPGLLADIRRAMGQDDLASDAPGSDRAAAPAPYTIEDAAGALLLPRDQIEALVALWRRKKNLILQGPPGVGKTFIANHLARLLIGERRDDQIRRVQFHPSYAYEDFVQGLRPSEGGGFARCDGPLLRICKDALEDRASTYVLVIDEINRGNLSKILGELLSLLEADKRQPEYAVTLSYGREDEPPFFVPPNLHVIGLMNTADRSLALVDYALRRRFAFFDVKPAFGTERFDELLREQGVSEVLRETIRLRISSLNQRISDDASLRSGFCIGHSYFCQRAPAYDSAWYRQIIDYEIEPLLREYWFDDPRLDAALAELRDD